MIGLRRASVILGGPARLESESESGYANGLRGIRPRGKGVKGLEAEMSEVEWESICVSVEDGIGLCTAGEAMIRS
jgi:hypothetical protein